MPMSLLFLRLASRLLGCPTSTYLDEKVNLQMHLQLTGSLDFRAQRCTPAQTWSRVLLMVAWLSNKPPPPQKSRWAIANFNRRAALLLREGMFDALGRIGFANHKVTLSFCPGKSNAPEKKTLENSPGASSVSENSSCLILVILARKIIKGQEEIRRSAQQRPGSSSGLESQTRP